ncbi:MAG TPA: serine/threonine-protein kinase [Planctomycetota bacterium]|nr:serine/threonine-protein kinase [Planctomycetota bacterium]
MKIGPYEVMGTLGRGGAATVFRARSPSGDEVAVKVLNAVDEDRLARFERESRLLGTFTILDGFVPLLDSGRVATGPFLVMPIIEGGTLRERLEEGPLGVAETLRLGRDLASALARAHAKGIVHRDLKPENVLFHEGLPLVADLGLGKHFDPEAPGASRSVSVSLPGQMRGTFGYMPAEQMRDAKSVGPEADVFALGAILYECLAGRPAFAGETLGALIKSVASGATEPLARLAPATPGWLVATIERALAPHPEDRYRDAASLLEALTPARRVRRTGRRVLAVALIIIVVALVAVFTTRRREEAPLPASPPPPPAAAAPVPTAKRTPGEADDLAVKLENGDGVPKDEAAAARLYREAALGGNAHAMLCLGSMLKAGRGVAKDEAEAVLWFRRAAEAGEVWGMVSLGQCLGEGWGTERDEAQAVLWYMKAAQAGSASGLAAFAFMLKDGRGVAKDEVQALWLLEQCAAAGVGWCRLTLADAYRMGQGAPKDPEKALRLYRERAEAGDALGMLGIGHMLRYGDGVDVDEAAAAEWYRKAAKAGEATALVHLGDLLRDAKTFSHDETEAVVLYKQAADLGSDWGCFRYGQALEEGRVVEKDEAEAVNYYRRASGLRQAHDALRRLGKE